MNKGFDVEITTALKDVGAIEIDGLQVFRAFEAFASGPALPCDVWVHALIEGRTYVVDELRAGRKPGMGPIRTEELRKIPVAEIVRRGAEKVVAMGQSPAEREETFRPKDLPEGEMLAHVAQIYRFGHLIGQPPTKLVAEYLGLSRAAAGRWISRARQEGHLGPALGTKAGEAVG